ncbi:ATP-dependent RNA helicase DHX58-like isoform X2 [Apostichopus japonicus]|uniref:ATP-dependent RNA helicase DHX58-like isoform X2 n=1 Tax=Stichopus japonicus TaxID=307972 RepID=UPI003AB7C631
MASPDNLLYGNNRKMCLCFLHIEPQILMRFKNAGLINNDVAEEVNNIQKHKKNTDAVEFLLGKLHVDNGANNSSAEEIFSKFKNCLTESGYENHKDLADHLEGLKPLPALSPHHQQFNRILQDVHPQLVEYLRPSNFLVFLTPIISKAEIESILALEKHEGAPSAAFKMLLLLQRTGSNWQAPFVRACEENRYTELAEALKLSLPPEGSSGEQSFDSKMETTDIDDVRSHTVQYESMDYDHGDNAGASSDLNSLKPEFHSSKYVSGKLDFELNIDKDEYEEQKFKGLKQGMQLRPYQKELSQNAAKGENTIILAPTGTGKTIVAVEVIRTHISKCDNPKVAFVVEKKALADQQEIAIKKFLDGGQVGRSNINVGKVTGDTVLTDLDTVFDSLHIVVLTAGVLSNDHRAVTDQKIAVSKFTLIIIDECHHCQKSHPYNRLMRMYREERNELISLGQSTDKLPQVVGLTATLGAGKKSRSVPKAVEHGLTILANMNAKNISMVEREKDSLAEYLNIPEEMTPVYVERREEDPIADKITELMTEIEREMESLPGYRHIPKASRIKPKDRQEYEQWVMTAIGRYCPEMVESGKERRPLIVCLEYLKIYQKALCINRDARSKDACTFLREQFEKKLKERDNFIDQNWKFERSFCSNIKVMEKEAIQSQNRNPLLMELEPLIYNEFKNNPDSRALLFTDTIESTRFLKQWIDESPKLKQILKSCPMTSETSEAQRRSSLQKFEDRDYNMMVVTSVMEEGIDIGPCNLVYRLNYVPSDCGRIQQKGRIRAENGKSFFVCYGNLKANEEMAKVMEKLMADAVKTIKAMTPHLLAQHLERCRKLDKRMTEEETRKRRLKGQSRDWKEYQLCCKKCSEEACTSFDIKRYNKSHHYVCLQSFCDEKIDIKPHHKPGQMDDLYKLGKIYCSSCAKDWGVLAKFHDLNIPVLKIDSFVVYEIKPDGSRGNAKVVKKWINAPFTVEDVDVIEDELSYDVDFESWN